MSSSKTPSSEESRSRFTCRLFSAISAPQWVVLALALACSASDTSRASDAPGGAPGGAAVAAEVEPAGPAPVLAHAVSASSAANGAGPDSLRATPEVYAGWRSFNVNCQSCHGFNAVGSDLAPDLRNSVGNGGSITHAAFRDVVREGRMARGMPAWGALLDGAQIDQIYAYLEARSSGKLGAGQPRIVGH